jgi:hypothetical protein
VTRQTAMLATRWLIAVAVLVAGLALLSLTAIPAAAAPAVRAGAGPRTADLLGHR